MDLITYQAGFINAARAILAGGGSAVTHEAALPAYSDPNPLVRFLFWKRLHRVAHHIRQRSPYRCTLDFGCGAGAMIPYLARAADQVIGVDLHIEMAQKMNEFLYFPPNVELMEVGHGRLTEIDEASVDLILALDVLEHVDELDRTLGEFRRILLPGGEIVVSGPTESFAYGIGRRLAGSEYTGDYHVRNIYAIADALRVIGSVKTVATLYYPLPLFKIYSCRI